MFDRQLLVSEATPGAVMHTMPGELLDGIGDLTQADLSALSMANLATLCDRIAHIKRSITHYEGILHRAMDQRFALRAQALRIAAGKTTGTVRLTEGDHVVIATLAKRPSYDQAKLKDAMAQLLLKARTQRTLLMWRTKFQSTAIRPGHLRSKSSLSLHAR